MHVVTSGLRRVRSVAMAKRSALVLASVVGVLGLSGVAAQFVPTSTANAAVYLRYQRGHYLDNGWFCYGWSSGTYHCTQHWHRGANGQLVSDNPAWVPNSTAATRTSEEPDGDADDAAPAARTSDPVARPAAPTAHRAAPTAHRAAPAARRAAPAARPAAPVTSGGSVANQIRAVFGPYSGQALRVATCESGLNPNAVNRASGASGVFQFLASTWATTSYAGYSRFNASANIHAAYQVFTRDGHSWREWSCQP